MQTIITIIILLAVAGYVGWRVFRMIKGKADPCACCEYKKNCKKFGNVK